MPNVTLNYFNGRGRAELSRLILAQADVQYTDNRIDYNQWVSGPELKAATPLGQLPYLDVDGVQIPQSLTVARYLAREHNLVGQNSLEQAQADALVDTVTDGYNLFVTKIVSNVARGDEAGLVEGTKSFLENDFSKHFGNIERLVQLYGQNGFSVGNSVTWADLAVHDFYSKIVQHYGDKASFDAFPLVQAVVRNVEALPNVAKYLQARLPTPF